MKKTNLYPYLFTFKFGGLIFQPLSFYLRFFLFFPGMIPSALSNPTMVCGKGKWLCPDKTHCIDEVRVCDRKRDCPSPVSPIIDSEKACEGSRDLRDWGDWSQSMCKTWTCKGGMWKCPDNITCITPDKVCDGSFDCRSGGGDEEPSLCEQWVCPIGTHRCKNEYNEHKCVSKSKLCDGFVHCLDKSDEDPSFCNLHDCGPAWFKCIDKSGNKKCINAEKVCDGSQEDDCLNDELNCEQWNCSEGYWKCHNNTLCINNGSKIVPGLDYTFFLKIRIKIK